MRVILDTNVLIAALMTLGSPPDRLYRAWHAGQFTLVSSELQIDEIRRVTRRAGVKLHISPAEAGRMVNDLRELAVLQEALPVVEVSPDPFDNFLLAMAEASHADILVTGDKRGLLDLAAHRGTRILTPRAALELLGD